MPSIDLSFYYQHTWRGNTKYSCPSLCTFHKNFTTLKENYFTKLDSYVLNTRCPNNHMICRDTETFIDHYEYVSDLNHTMLAEYLTKIYSFDKKESRKTGKRGR